MSDPVDDPPSDPDREAILRRRRHFVALALSGLAAASAAGCDTGPTVCLDIAPMDGGPSDAGPDASDGGDSGRG